jgi:alpha-glucosidase
MKKLLILVFILLFITFNNTHSSYAEVADIESGVVFNKWTITSPNKEISIHVIQKRDITDNSNDKKLFLSTVVEGKEALTTPPLGVTINGSDGNFIDNLTPVNVSNTTIKETYSMVSGKKSIHHNYAHEMILTFMNSAGKMMKISFRAYDDGIAYRYFFPGKGYREVISESSGWKIPIDSLAWLQKYHVSYERPFTQGKIGKSFIKGSFGFPALFLTPEKIWILLTEAAVYGDYSASHLAESGQGEGVFTIKLPDNPSGNLPWKTPWRVAIIGKKPGIIVESVLVDNLNPPSELHDVSWIKPGRVAFPWWSDHHVNAKYEKLKSFVDLAHLMRWEYIEFDVALVGGKPLNNKWETTDWIPDLVEYAHNKNVDVYGWDSWENLDTPHERDKVLGLYKKWGIKGIKVDYLYNDSQEMMKFYDEIIKATLQKEMMISFHGSTIPRGQRRRWPHIMTWESVLGAEHYTFSLSHLLTSSHNCILPFTRNVIGPMDYTPVTFLNQKRTTTDAHELALSVIFESGWQCFADTPEAYSSSPGKNFLKLVPAHWDDIHFIDGYPGKFVCLARRKDKNWFICGINADETRNFMIPLSFLKEGTYKAIHYKDGSNGRISVDEITIQSDKLFQTTVAPHGGFCIHVFDSQS